MDKDINVLLFEQFSEKPIAYARIYAKISGSVTAGLLLSQLVYWDKTMRHKEFYKTDKDLCNELCMGTKELSNAKKRLTSLGFVETERKGIPCRTFYKVNVNKIINEITSSAERAQPVPPKGHNWNRRKGVTTTETTTENKTETKEKEIYKEKEKTEKLDKEQLNELQEMFPTKTVSMEYVKAMDWCLANGKKYKDYMAFMRNWLRKSKDTREPPPEPQPEINYEVLDLINKGKMAFDGKGGVWNTID